MTDDVVEEPDQLSGRRAASSRRPDDGSGGSVVSRIPAPTMRVPTDGCEAVGLLVLGMHRSGTSAVTGLLAGAGLVAGIGDDQIRPDRHNSAGYFERVSVGAFNDRVLARAGGAWDEPPARENLDAVRDEFLSELYGLFDRMVDATPESPVVIKDPRISLLLPLWLPVVGTTLHPVLVIRNPLETARSLASRDEMPLFVGLALWELYMSALLDGLDGRDVYAVRFEDVVETPRRRAQFTEEVLQAIRPSLLKRVALDDEASSIDRTLRRNRSSESEFVAHATVRQVELWAFFAGLSMGPVTLRAPESLRRPGRAARVALHEHAGVKRRAAGLELQINEASAELTTLHAESALRAERADELQTAVDLLAGKIEAQTVEFRQRVAEHGRDTRQLDDLGGELDDARRRADSAERASGEAAALAARIEEVNHQLEIALENAAASTAALRSELVDVRTSETWRIGQVIIRPIAWLRKRSLRTR